MRARWSSGDRLTKLSGKQFDREYMKAMVDDHEKALNEGLEKKGT